MNSLFSSLNLTSLAKNLLSREVSSELGDLEEGRLTSRKDPSTLPSAPPRTSRSSAASPRPR